MKSVGFFTAIQGGWEWDFTGLVTKLAGRLYLLLFISLGLHAVPSHSHSCNIFCVLALQKHHSLRLVFHVDFYYVTPYFLL